MVRSMMRCSSAVVAGASVHGGALVPHQNVADTPAVVVDEAVLRGVLG